MDVLFLTDLDVRKVENGRWLLVNELRAVITDGGRQEVFAVPAGFETDFASVPRLPLAFLLTGDTAHKAAVLHDRLYSIGADRAFADRVFRAAMQAEGVSSWRRGLMWAAVRAFGWTRYRGQQQTAR